MKLVKHSKPYRATQIALALVVALAAAAAAQSSRAQSPSPQAQPQMQPQAQAGQSAQTARQPAPAGPSYGPVLHPQTTKSEPGAQPEQSPQAQEEKAGGMPQQQPHKEADPSARPAPQQTGPAGSGAKARNQQSNAAPRRAVQQGIVRVPEVQPDAVVSPAVPVPGQPAVPGAGTARLNSCLGNTCTDTGGTTYQTNVGNAGVSSEGRLCTRNGANVQCF